MMRQQWVCLMHPQGHVMKCTWHWISYICKVKPDVASKIWVERKQVLLPGPRRRLAPVIKCRRFLPFFQRYVRDTSLTWDISRARYFQECSLAHWNLFRYFEKRAFSSLEPTIILTCGRDQELWPDPIFWKLYHARYKIIYRFRPA